MIWKKLVESTLPAKVIAEAINYDLNIMALDLIIGIQGDLVIDKSNVWVFTDSLEHAERIIQAAQYDVRFFSRSKELKPIVKDKKQKREDQVDYSVKILLTNELSPSQIAFYAYYPTDKHFYLKEEFQDFW